MNNKELYLIISESSCLHYDIFDITKMAIENEIKIIQLREKSISTRKFFNLAEKINKIIEKKAKFIINDRLDIAIAVDADGIHIGNEDLPYSIARKILGKKKIIGISVNNISELELANKIDCDYIGISGVFHSNTKNIDDHIWSYENLKKAKEISKHYSVGVGGINENNLENVSSFFNSIAIIRAICGSQNPEKSIKDLKKKFYKDI